MAEIAQAGIHHVTAMAGGARRNHDFYTRVLGLRFVKRTVNFDDPGTYHFYFGDEAGSPGTIMTFFPWEHAAAGRPGAGETRETAFRIPQASLAFWMHRLTEAGIAHDMPHKRFGETVLPFRDPDGTALSLVAVAGAEAGSAFATDAIGAQEAIRGFHGATLESRAPERTGAILAQVLGFSEIAREGDRVRYASGAELGGFVDVVPAAQQGMPRLGAGSVHHIAFRARDDAYQAEMTRRLAETFGIVATEQKDRNYFRSVYFREPGGILFEIATDSPGFAVDEDPAHLGEALKLPAPLEPRRAQIAAMLPALD